MRSKNIGLLLLLGLVMPLGACDLIGGGGEGTEENQGAENNQSEDEEDD